MCKKQLKDMQSDFDTSLLPKKFLTKPNVVEFANSFPQTFAEAVKLLCSKHVYVKDDVLQNRIRLASLGRKFHSEADTLTNTIENQWALLNDPTTKLLVSAHQPNLFAYSGVFKKVVLLETLKTTIEKYKESGIVNLFVIIDHDFINEIWMRRAQLPSFHHSSGLLQLRFSVDHLKRWAIMSKVPRPPEKILYNWRKEIISWIKKSSSSPSHRAKMVDNLNSFWEIVESAYSKAGSYSDFNAFLMSKIVNSVWRYNTLFVRLSEISKVFQNGFQFLLSNLTTYTDALRGTEQMLLSQGESTGVSSTSYDKAPMWLHCNCGSKARLSVSKHEKFAFTGSCLSCKKELTLYLAADGYNGPDLSKVISFISPRAISLPLLLSLDLQISCYCSGKGAIGYLTDANAISKHLGIAWPLILVWDSKDDYMGMAQKQALNAVRMKITEAKSRLQELHSRDDECKIEIRKLVNKRTELAEANGSLSSILEDLFQLKEEQRRIRREKVILEKATKILNLRPCILDYAVNFGMANTEKQWHRHLLENGNLTAAVSFDGD
jgi:hypothetical protein